MFGNLYVIVVVALFGFFALILAYTFVKKFIDDRRAAKFDDLDRHAADNFNMQFYQPKR